uniref:SBF1/SBF2 domain-containing protein n=1 Tax=Astatotilapia calliptera TaxID=8154 RepID=A0A3P8N9S6_ASTCA
MEGVAVDNLIDFDLPSETKTLNIDGGQHQGHTDIFSPEPASSTGVHQLPEPMAPTKPNSHHQSEEGNNDSDATESADSENDMDPPSHEWELRRSSSSSAHSGEEADAETVERRQFMKTYVEKVFHGKEDFDQEEKARFGELCSGENGKGREWFAKYVSAQRCHSKCVSEATFYRLVQSFAVVLFECYQMDDYSPAKNLMTMCFTYYYVGKSQPSPSELLDRGGAPAGLDSYLNKANTWLSGKKDAAERLLKHTSKTDVKGFFGGLESKLRSSVAPKSENKPESIPACYISSSSSVSGAPEEKKGEKVYLYTHLKQQPIWHTLRFWNAAFFDAVHCERKKRSPTTRMKRNMEKWCHMTDEEKKDSYKIDENIAFGQLGTFTHNMLAFGLSRKLCNDFLKKQAVIGNLNEEQYKLLTEHIERMAAE